MTGDDDIPSGVPEDELLAAELALGALDLEARAGLLARAEWDPAFAAKVSAWEERLAPMAEGAAAAPPPPSARRRLMHELFGPEADIAAASPSAAAPGATPAAPRRGTPPKATGPADPPPHSRLRREVAGWRALAVALAAGVALAVSTPGLLPLQFGAPSTQETRYIAWIGSEDGSVGFFAALDSRSGEALVRRISAGPPGDAVYQMWMANEGAPVSMGLLEEESALRMPPELLGAGGGFMKGAHFGISLEPPGGSPTGKPSKVVATGAPEAF